MKRATATCVILAKNSSSVLRKRVVTTFEEVTELRAKFPRHDIAVFEDPKGETGEMWAFYPEVQDPKFWR